MYKRQEYACFVNCENFQAMFRALDDEYMQARAADIGDISPVSYTHLESSRPVYKDGMTVRLACVITAVRLKSTRNGSMMA